MRAISVAIPGDATTPAYSQPQLLDPEDDFPDGAYEIVVPGGQIFPLVKRNGVYEWKV